MKSIILILFLGYASAKTISNTSPVIVPIVNGLSGDAITTRYWDCCAPLCAADNIANIKNGHPVQSCQADGTTNSTAANNANDGCQTGGVAFPCNNQQPYLINDTLAYGWTAASFTGDVDTSKCCACFLLSFKDKLAGKQFLVQNINSGIYILRNHFKLQIPGGGMGIPNLGCMSQWNTGPNGWGDRYNGVSTEDECHLLPEALQPGCRFRFEYMEDVFNPNVSFQEVECPAELVAVSGCEYAY